MTTKGLERLNRLCAVVGLLALCVVLGMPVNMPLWSRAVPVGVFTLAVIGNALIMNKTTERARRRSEEVREYMMKRRGT